MKFWKTLFMNRRQLNYHSFKETSLKYHKRDKPVETMSSVYEKKESTKEETSEQVSEDSEIEPKLQFLKLSL